ncbi:hypothetical protein [uncultured Eubacterium sp.]|uniref:hypothetical protein n=1 Tax=uncultured Eubacterium sp. TaxID=165185 RepID=UPI002595B9AD|nr:hypothetical protein [uncultured Eubacterium sp.]
MKNKDDSSIKQWVVIGEYLRLNPTKEDLKHAREEDEEIIFIYEGDDSDIVTESWWVDKEKGLAIDFSYCLSAIENMVICRANYYNPLVWLREKHFESNNIEYTPQYMRSITIPKRFIKDNGIVNLKRFLY